MELNQLLKNVSFGTHLRIIDMTAHEKTLVTKTSPKGYAIELLLANVIDYRVVDKTVSIYNGRETLHIWIRKEDA